jgi:hypothetical protein
VIYEGRGEVEALEAGLRKVRLRSLVRSFWRGVPLGVAVALLASSVAVAARPAELFPGQVLVQIGLVLPLMLCRAWIPPLSRRRIAVARGLVQAFARGPAMVRLDLGSTERSDLRNPEDPDALVPPAGTLRDVYLNPWLRFETPLAGGGALRFERRERVCVDRATPERRRTSRSTHGVSDHRGWSWTDAVDIDLGESDYRGAAAAPSEAIASGLQLPKGTTIDALDVEANRVRVVVRSLTLTQARIDTIRDAASAIALISRIRELVGPVAR